MVRYEGDPEYAAHSARRFARASELLASSEPGAVTSATMRAFLSDHEDEPDSLCRHPERTPGSPYATTFWWVADLTEIRLEFGRGNPCDSIAQEHRFPAARDTAA